MIKNTHSPASLPSARILIFDSGLGGLSIFREIHRQYPHCSLCYVSDNAAFPYGTQSDTALMKRIDTVLHQCQSIIGADIIVIACNTASTIILPRIRQRFTEPVIGVVPAIKPAATISQSKRIGLLATPATIDRDYTHQLVKRFAADCQIIAVGSSELVYLAEGKLQGKSVKLEQLAPIIEPFRHNAVDTLILACTHFPLLATELQAALPEITHWVDSGEAIARRVGYHLHQLEPRMTPAIGAPTHSAYFTQENHDTPDLHITLTDFAIKTIHYVTITD